MVIVLFLLCVLCNGELTASEYVETLPPPTQPPVETLPPPLETLPPLLDTLPHTEPPSHQKPPPPPPPQPCRFDLGFVVDSSGSMKYFYHRHRAIIKFFIRHFDLSATGTRAALVRFSTRAELSIKLHDYVTSKAFNKRVDKLSLFEKYTRIDRGLVLARDTIFAKENGGREVLPKLLILITDGNQTVVKNARSPTKIAHDIRAKGIKLVVIGNGVIEAKKLSQIAGGGKWYKTSNLMKGKAGEEFAKDMQKMMCPPTPTCKGKFDIGFVLDSSGSLRYHYHFEKEFIAKLSEAFDIRADGSRAGVVTFSNNAELSIKLNEYSDLQSFVKAVQAIPLMKGLTRIDRALHLADMEFFKSWNGGRKNVPKLLIILTDGSQTPAEDALDPVAIAEHIRARGIKMLVIGIGVGINKKELMRIGGGAENTFDVESFAQLTSEKFVNKMKEAACNFAGIAKEHHEEHHLDNLVVGQLKQEGCHDDGTRDCQLLYEQGRCEEVVTKQQCCETCTSKPAILVNDVLSRIKDPVQMCYNIYDISYILDLSRDLSPYSFKLVQKYIKLLSAGFGVSDEGTQAGVMTTGDDNMAHINIKLSQYGSVRTFQDGVSTVKQPSVAPRLKDMLHVARTRFFKPEHGARRNLVKVPIVITDSPVSVQLISRLRHTRKREKSGERMHFAVVAVGDAIDVKLSEMAKDGVNTWLRVTTYDKLLKTNDVENMVEQTCSLAKPCINRHRNCDRWAREGDCVKLRSFMMSGCCESCSHVINSSSSMFTHRRKR